MSLVSQALVAHCLHWSRNHIRCMGSHLAAHMSFWRSELWQPCMRSGSLQAAQRVPVAGRSASRWLVWQNLLELNLLEIINIQKASAVASLLSLSPPPVSCARCCFLAALAPSRASSSPLALLSAPGATFGLFRHGERRVSVTGGRDADASARARVATLFHASRRGAQAPPSARRGLSPWTTPGRGQLLGS